VDLSRGALQVAADPESPPGTTRFLLQAPGGQPGVQAFGPQARQQSKDGLTQVIEGIVPTDFHLSTNGLRTASSLKLTMPFVACPIDPRTLRACAVEFYLGTIPGGDAVAENAGRDSARTDGSVNIGAEPLDVLPDTWTDAAGQPRTNLRFQGWTDSWECEWSGDKISDINLDCTDNTRLLLNVDAPAKGQVSKDLPLDQAVAKYLTFSPIFGGLSVEYRPGTETAPTLASVLHSSAFIPGQGPPVSLLAGGQYEKASVFDYLSDVCRSVGHSLFMDGIVLVIQRVRSITSSNVPSRPNDPYLPRTMPDGTVLPYRRFVYGRNLSKIHFKRNMTRHAPANISVRAYNPDTKQVLVERFPLAADVQALALPGDTVEQKWLELNIGGGVVDRKTMRVYAQEVYESLWRQEVGVELETMNLSSYGGGNDDPDILDLQFGDTVEALFSRDDFYSTLGPTQQKLDAVGANAQLLKDVGFPDDFAQAYAAAYTNAGLQQIYRVHNVDIEGSSQDGVSVKIHCVNYVEVTSDKSLDASEEPPAAPAAASPATVAPAVQGLPALPPPSVGPT
jgi:hypothetical protein